MQQVGLIKNEVSELITIARFRDLAEAELARGKLEAEGIPAFLADQCLVGLDWNYSNAVGGVRLQVPKEYAEEARDILKADNSAALSELETSTHFSQKESCPSCGSTTLRQTKLSRKSGAISLLLSLPIFFWGTRIVCQRCGHSWIPESNYEPFPDIPAAVDPDDVARKRTDRNEGIGRDTLARLVWILMGLVCLAMLYQYTR
jgi:predicted RNA-binding Zn-ribbon protein involved in translation (DUF1610 family)